MHLAGTSTSQSFVCSTDQRQSYGRTFSGNAGSGTSGEVDERIRNRVTGNKQLIKNCVVKGNDRQMDGKSVWRSFKSEKNGKKFELLPDIIEKNME